MSSFIKKYPRAKVSRHATIDGWVIDLIQREGAKPKRVAATYSTIPWASHAARVKLGLNPTPPKTITKPAPIRQAPAAVLPSKPAPKQRATKDAGTCTPCGRPMRPAGTKAADYPNTTLRQRENLCQSCCQSAKAKASKAKPRCAEAIVEDVEFLAGTGASREEVEERLGKSWETITRQLYRVGRQDLIEKVKPSDLDKAAGGRKAHAA